MSVSSQRSMRRIGILVSFAVALIAGRIAAQSYGLSGTEVNIPLVGPCNVIVLLVVWAVLQFWKAWGFIMLFSLITSVGMALGPAVLDEGGAAGPFSFILICFIFLLFAILAFAAKEFTMNNEMYELLFEAMGNKGPAVRAMFRLGKREDDPDEHLKAFASTHDIDGMGG